jgi:choline dehydrogenase-like flavoprotein
VNAAFEEFKDRYYFGRNPTEGILTNYRNIGRQEMDYVGGFTTFSAAYRRRGIVDEEKADIGSDYKERLSVPGDWEAYMYMQGETIPKATNHVRLSDEKKDQWGIPLLVTSVGYDDNDEKMIKDFLQQSSEMLEKAGGKILNVIDSKQAPGLDIHEMGGVRMGKDPKTAMLNEWNQLHHCKNVFVTDGACMTSTGNQSPSILYMALTARAVNYAVSELKKQNL